MFGEKWQGRRAAAHARKVTRELQRAFAGGGGIGRLSAQLDAFVSEKSWRVLKSSRGTEFADFGDYACDEHPNGLALREEKTAKFLKAALLAHGHVDAWLQILKRIVRPKGRPRTTLAPGEDFQRFYPANRTLTSTDSIFLGLDNAGRSDLLEAIGRGEIKAKAAAILAGLIEEETRPGPVVDLPRFRNMSVPAQAKWAGRVLRAMSPEARCLFAERELGREGKELAAQWQEGQHNNTQAKR